MKSFVHSLPSHRKKERGRRSRRPRRGGGDEDGDGRSRAGASSDGRRSDGGGSPRRRRRASPRSRPASSPQRSPESVVEATEVQYPPPAGRVAGGPVDDADAGRFGRNDDGDDDDGDRPAGSSEEAQTLSRSQETVVEGTEFQYYPPPPPPPPTAGTSVDARGGGVAGDGSERERAGREGGAKAPFFSAGDPRPSPVRSSRGGPEYNGAFDEAFDEATVAAAVDGADSPPPTPSRQRERRSDFGSSAGEAEGAASGSGEGENNMPYEGNETSAQEGAEVPRGTRSGASDRSLEAESRGDGGRRRSREGNRRFETEPVMNDQASGEIAGDGLPRRNPNPPVDANESPPGNRSDGEAPGGEPPRGAERTAEDEVALLTTSDLDDCVAATERAHEIVEACDPDRDPFGGIDVERWRSVFADFKRYVAALGDATSDDAAELRNVDARDRAFAIFDRGADVNHCNAVFVCDMIRAMRDGIDGGRGRRPPSSGVGDARGELGRALDRLAACLDALFGASDGSDRSTSSFAVDVTKDEGDDSTILRFSKAPSEQASDVSAAQPPSSSDLPPHIRAMSDVFARYSEESTRPLRSQLDSAWKTLSAARGGAMDLQRQALKLQGDLQEAQDEVDEERAGRERAEAELGRLKYEFGRREESFERVKEHYKSEVARKEQELANARERHERELEEAKAELAKLRLAERRRSEPKSTEPRKRKGSRGDERRTRQMPPDPNATLRDQEASDDDDISPSIPRKIQYQASDPFEDDVDGPRKRSKLSDRPSRHSTGTMRQSRPAPYDVQPPRRSRAASEPRGRVADRGAAVRNRSADKDGQAAQEAGRRLRRPDRGAVRHRSTENDGQERETGRRLRQQGNRSTDNDGQVQEIGRRLCRPDHGAVRHRSTENDGQEQETGRRLRQQGGARRNPLNSLTENGSVDRSSDDNFFEKKEPGSKRERSARKDPPPRNESDGQDARKPSTSSKKREAATNPYLKQPKPAKKGSGPEAEGEPAFAFQEVVRGRAARQALPGRECEECRKFFDALGDGFDRSELVNECSRHRARHAPPSTPPDFWRLSFIDD